MKRYVLALALLVMLVALALFNTESNGSVSANNEGSFSNFAMPIEYVNYTITSVNGSLWAKINGFYPIFISNRSKYDFLGELPIVYPMPPNSANIQVFLADEELSWINFTQTYPEMVHHTALGDWWMIYSTLSNVPDFLVLKIQYEHPVQIVNGKYVILYDLNIESYLSDQNNNSTCHYTIQIQENIADLHAYTVETDSKWNPINYTSTTEGTTQIIYITEHSQYLNPSGNLIVEFSTSKTNDITIFHTLEIHHNLITIVLVVIFIVIFTVVGRHRKTAKLKQ